MLTCPHCQADLKNLAALPETCPACGKPLAGTGDDRSSVQAMSDSTPTAGTAEVFDPTDSRCAATIESGDSSMFDEPVSPEGSGSAEMQTFVSDEFEDPATGKTMISEEFSVEVPAGGGAPEQTVASGEFDDPAAGKTVQADDLAGSGAEGGDDSYSATVVSDQWDASGATMLSDELPPDAVKTMQTYWEGAFHGKTSPSMTIKGKGDSGSAGKSSLVIKERALASPGETVSSGKEAEYELIRVLGEGGMGVVYDARQTSVDRSVAVKMLKPKTAGDEKQRQKFLAEAVVTGDLDHPNIVPIYDVGTSERGLLFYAMKKVKGTPWMKLLPQKSQAENVGILLKVADAVAFAHSRGVIHRDLKPENVMLGDFGEVLVMDWGLALPAPGFSKSTTVSPAHSMGGTPAYMAPEMASGPLDKISFSADVYLLGAILYEILTGRPPHSGKNTMQCLFAAAKNEIRASDKSGELMDIAMTAMATDPAKRYATVRVFQEAIRDYQSHTESIALSTRAAEEFEKARTTDDYRDFSRALFAYEEALVLWDGNSRAKTGLVDVKLKYADSAYRKGDYDLGLSLLDAKDQQQAPLARQLQAAQAERAARQQRLKTMKTLAASLVALFVVGVTVAAVWINHERTKAVAAEKDASEQRDIAVAAEEEANTQRDNAVAAEKETKKQRDIAVAAKEEANTQRDNAVAAEKETKKQRDIAVAAKEEANTQRDNAVAAEKETKKQRDRAEYEAYIAQIGLAAAKIDENAFGSAREILRACKPELRNWEWGRLMYLCDEPVRPVDAGAPLDAVAFAPDGARFVSGGWKSAAQIWETATGKLLASAPDKAAARDGIYVQAVAFSPDGRFVAVGGNDPDGYLRLCDAATGSVIREFGSEKDQRHNNAVQSVSFSRDGKTLLSASDDKTVRLWDVDSGALRQALRGHTYWVWSAAFSPDESQIISASHDGSAIIWRRDAAGGEYRRYRQFLGHQGPVFAAAFSPDGQRAATAGYDKRVLVWRPDDLREFDFRKLAAGEPLEQPPMIVLDGHGAPVRAVSFSEDGDFVLSGSHDNTVKIWDSRSGRTLKTFRGHNSWVRACAFSPDKRTIVSVSHDHEARLWNIAGYEEVRVLQSKTLAGHSDAVLSVSFDRAGDALVTASRDRTARTWDFRSGRELKTFEEGHSFLASSAVFFPDGKRLLTSAVDNTVRFWDVASGTQKDRLEHTGRAAALALSHDARWILTGSDRKTARLWNAATRELVAELSGHQHEITAVAFSPDDRFAVTADANGVAILWNIEKPEPVKLHLLRGHSGKINAAAFSSDGKRALTASNDKTVAQWDVETGRERRDLVLRHPEGVVSVAAVPGTKGQVLTACLDGAARVWNADDPRAAPETLEIKGTVNFVVVDPQGRRALLVDSAAQRVHLWDLGERHEILAPAENNRFEPFLDLKAKKMQLWTAAFRPDGEGVLTVGGADARLWDIDTRREKVSFSPHGIVAQASFSPDAARIVTASWDNSARIWNAATGKDELKLEGHKGFVNSAVFSPDGRHVLTASDDRLAIIWDSANGKKLIELAGHTDRVLAAVYSPDEEGQWILTASSDKTARLWKAKDGKLVGTFEGHKWAVLSAAFSADGKRVITGSEDNTARIWDLETREQLFLLEGHTASVTSVAFLHDGRRAVTGSQDNTAKVWDALAPKADGKGQEILTLKGHTQEVTCVNTSTSGRYVVTGSRDGTAVVWLAVDWHERPVAAAE